MEEHTFGTFSTDRLKFLHERASVLGVQHRARTVPADPEPGEPFSIIVTGGPDFPADAVMVDYTITDGDREEAGTLEMTPERRFWSTPAWGYVTEWRAGLPALPEGALLHYRIRARGADGSWQWADWPDPKRAVEEALMRDEEIALPGPGGGATFALSIDRFAPPAWARDALVYQVFLDRFALAEDGPWPGGLSLGDIHGGALRGVTRNLDYIASLGATCLWLTPLFPSPTHHRYDATDYFDVDPRLGSKEELRELVARAHERGIRVLLDLACNHLCDEHPYFQQALAEPEHPYRSWFHFEPGLAGPGYRAFFGVETMPEWNTDHPEVRAHLIEAAMMWVREFDVDGFRLDYAHGPSHAFWAHFWRALKRLKPDVWCFGEIVDIPDTQLSYLGYLDGVLDFQLQDMLRRTFAYQSRDLVAWEHFLRAHEAFFPPQNRFSRPAFFDNHDTDRFLFAAGGSEARLRLAALVLYTLPNPPILYYGTEVALEQSVGKEIAGLEASRAPMAWEQVESRAALLAFFRRLGALRREEPAMRPDSRETLFLSPEQYLGRHERAGSELFLVLNRAGQLAVIEHPLLSGSFTDLFDGATLELSGSVTLDAESGRLLKRRGV